MSNSTDTYSTFISLLHNLTGNSWKINYSIYCVGDNNLLKGGVFIAVLWGWWFFETPSQKQNRKLVLATIFSCLLTIGANQTIHALMPFRERPYSAHLAGVTFPYDLGYHRSSSFPSDHAALFFALTTALFYFSWRAGLLAALYTVFIICLPRLYLGLHYPTDILGGAIIGITIVCLVNGTRIGEMIGELGLKLAERSPAIFYACAFLLTYQLATLFDDARALGTWFSVLIS